MKFILVLTFIFFSLLSTIVENEEIQLTVNNDCITKTVSAPHADTDCKDEHKNDCHDSNCFGSAHFGHGFYYQDFPYQVSIANPWTPLKISFQYFNHESFVTLDSLFRPPLKA